MKNFALVMLGITTMVIGSVLVFSSVQAQGLAGARSELEKAVGKQPNGENTLGLSEDLSGTIATVVQGVLALVGTIFLLLTIYAGILWMTARGAEEQIERAQNIIRATIIGLFITMAAYAITFFVAGRLSGKSTASTANSCETTGRGGRCVQAQQDCMAPAVTINDTDCDSQGKLCCVSY
jgi:cytochrome bd-type quinol oxidase subunit 2